MDMVVGASSSAPSERVHPMASRRRRRMRSKEEDDEVPEKNTEQSEGPFPGGPEDTSLINSFNSHIAYKIWAGDPNLRGILKMVHHGHKLEEWNLDEECDAFKKKIEQSGLVNLARYTFMHINRYLISGFVERWYPETNSFHLPFGEMTMTIDDVKQILDIPIRGKALRGPAFISTEEGKELVCECLGLSEEVVKEELEANRGNSVRLEWLRKNFSNITDTSSEEELDRAVRGYLLFVLGCTLFADKTGTRVSVAYLRPLKNIEEVKDYAWGVAGLAYMYKQLGLASRFDVKQIAGYLTFMEAWIYEHFVEWRTTVDYSYREDWPRMRRWKTKNLTGHLEWELSRIREGLDDLSAKSVIWDPYKDARQYHAFDEVAWYSGCILCFDFVESYNVDRVLRQFGRIQIIPRAPLAPERAIRGSKSKGHKVEYKMEEQYWTRWYDHVLSARARGPLVVNPWDCSKDYIEWFMKVSHPCVQPPTLRHGIERPNSPVLHRIIDDWRPHRDAAIELLEESLALGENQGIRAVLERERKIHSILRWDLNHGEIGEEQAPNAKRKRKGKGMGKGQAIHPVDGRKNPKRKLK